MAGRKRFAGRKGAFFVLTINKTISKKGSIIILFMIGKTNFWRRGDTDKNKDRGGSDEFR